MKIAAVVLSIFLSSQLFAQTADFSFQTQGNTFCAPQQVQFTQSSSGNPVGFIWDFGDGSQSNSASPAHSFSAAGTYNVKLIVIYSQFTLVVSKPVLIHPANSINVIADRNYICQPGDITFTTPGGSQSSYQWDFGDGQSATGTSSSITHNFGALNNYTVQVQATDTSGCIASSSVSVSVRKPTITGSITPRNGCVPANAAFTSSVVVPAGSTVSSYNWDFGDGTTLSTAANTAAHTYITRGQYNPTLSIITSEGCTADFNFPVTAYGTPPSSVNAYAITSPVCASSPAQFVAVSPGANQYNWMFGDGSGMIATDTIVSHKYASLGNFNTNVVAIDNGCVGISAVVPVDVIGVIASYNFNINCGQRDKVIFNDMSTGNVTSFLWDFKDGTYSDSVRSPVHDFPASGAFNVELKVRDSITGCRDSLTRLIVTAVPVMINKDTFVCHNTVTIFNVQNTYQNPAATYSYHVVSTITAPIPQNYLYIKAFRYGVYSNYVVIDNGPNYCKDTAYLDHPITVRGPVADFSLDSSICLYDSLVVSNNTSPFFPQDSVYSYKWYFGNGDSSLLKDPASVSYASPGNYPVKLLAMDKNNCVDSLTKNIRVNGLPFLRVIPESDTLCAGNSDTLIAFHTDPVLWTSNQSLPCVNCDTLAVSPANDAYYSVKATNAAGCISEDTIQIKVYPRFDAIALNPASSICRGDTVSLHVNPQGLMIQWTPSSGLSNTNVYDPVASPSASTIYTAVLRDQAGCFSDSAFFNVHVKPPALVNAGNDTTLHYFQPFTLRPAYSSNIASYQWSPQGDLQCTTCPFPSGNATISQFYTIHVESDSGCVASDSVQIYIACEDAGLLLPNAFTPNNDGLNDVFFPAGHGVTFVKKFTIYDRKGEVIFQRENFPTNQPQYGWDGRIHGEPVSPAVYVYYIEALCSKGETLSKKGVVTLIR